MICSELSIGHGFKKLANEEYRSSICVTLIPLRRFLREDPRDKERIIRAIVNSTEYEKMFNEVEPDPHWLKYEVDNDIRDMLPSGSSIDPAKR